MLARDGATRSVQTPNLSEHGGPMQRRDFSTILIASSGATMVATRSADAPTSNTPDFATTAAERAAGVTPVNPAYMPGDVRRYGADPTGSADSTVAIQTALNIVSDVYLPAGFYLTTAALNNAV